LRTVVAPRVRLSRDLLFLAVLLGATAWAATRAARLELDIENRSMRSQGNAEARAEELREQHFGHDATVVTLLEAEPPGSELDSEEWIEALRARPEVDTLLELPDDDEGLKLVAFTLVPAADGTVGEPLASITDFLRAGVPTGTRLSLSGSPAGEAAIAAALDLEQRRIIPLVALVLFTLLALVYRSLALALGILLPALGGIAWTGALQEALGLLVNPVTALLPPVLLAVGVAGTVHLVDGFVAARARGLAPDAAAHHALREVLWPALGCALTTVIGFLALCLSPIPAIQRFGGLAAAGVLVTALLSFLAVPPWLRVCARSERLARRASELGPWRRGATALARQLARRAGVLVGLALVSALVLGWAWTRIDVDTDPLRILPAHHPFRVETERIATRLGGTDTFDLVLSPPEPAGGFLKLAGLQQALLELDGVARPAGLPRRASDGTGLVTMLLEPGGSQARERTFAAAEALARAQGWSTVQATGSAVRVARDSGAIGRGEVYGLAATFLALGPCLWFGLRSGRLTAVALLANLWPCLLMHGGLVLLGRPLTVASAMIGSVILGLVVDDAIYFLHGFRAARARARERVAVAHTLRTSGRAMSVTSLVLALGFSASLSGELSTTREFGALAASTILAAWGANLFLLPALLLLLRARARRASA